MICGTRAIGLCVSLWTLALLPVFGQEDDPTIDAKPLSQWVKQLRSENRGLQLRAAQALASAPTNLHARIMPQVLPVLKSERENDKFVAAQTLGEYGAAAKPAVPDLLPMLEGTQYERNRAAAAKALGQILKDSPASEEIEKVVTALIAKFTDKYADVRREAAYACGMIGPAAKACLPHLPPLMRDTSVNGALGFDGHDGYGVRCAAAYACGRMGGTNAAVHLDLLISLMHSDGRVNPALAEAVGIIGPINDNVVKNLVDAFEANARPVDWPGFKLAILKALERCGPKAAPAVPFLIHNLEQNFVSSHMYQPPQYVPVMMRIFVLCGPAAKEAVPVIKKYAELKQFAGGGGGWKPEETAEIRKAAAAALAAIAGQPGPAAEKRTE